MKLLWILQVIAARVFKAKSLDVTGAKLVPGNPDKCQGNGEHPFFECCCDECDYYLDCFPEYDRCMTCHTSV